MNTSTNRQPLWTTKCLIQNEKHFLSKRFVCFLRNNKGFMPCLLDHSLGTLSLAIITACNVSVPWLWALLEGPGFTLSQTLYDRVIFLEQDSDLGSQLPNLHPLRRNLAKGSFVHHLKEQLYKKTLLCMSNVLGLPKRPRVFRLGLWFFHV